MRATLAAEHRITVVSAVDYFQFTPSNPWLAVGWRDRKSITLPIAPLLRERALPIACRRRLTLPPNRLAPEGRRANPDYDYPVITTGPELVLMKYSARPHGDWHASGLQGRPMNT
ncbi:hypothetical protein [Candidatus Aalborgicola defluviihabitans]|uniref:hypothetical protein n=1 Tax=Candidatus Aalborgicola defluviihabitans TaxID=3386187 RepID=UPI001E0A6755|nr:hypothetical protein [Burkholderiales bacterium]